MHTGCFKPPPCLEKHETWWWWQDLCLLTLCWNSKFRYLDLKWKQSSSRSSSLKNWGRPVSVPLWQSRQREALHQSSFCLSLHRLCQQLLQGQLPCHQLLGSVAVTVVQLQGPDVDRELLTTPSQPLGEVFVCSSSSCSRRGSWYSWTPSPHPSFTFTHIRPSVCHILGKAASAIFWQSYPGWTTPFTTTSAAIVQSVSAQRNIEHCQDFIWELWCNRPLQDAVWATKGPATNSRQVAGPGKKSWNIVQLKLQKKVTLYFCSYVLHTWGNKLLLRWWPWFFYRLGREMVTYLVPYLIFVTDTTDMSV